MSHESIRIYYHRIKRILSFLKKVLKLCENKPKVVADGGSRYPPGSEKKGLEYRHENLWREKCCRGVLFSDEGKNKEVL